MRFLAIDPGTKRTGLAIGGDVTGIVQPIGVIETSSLTEQLRQIGEALAQHGPDEVVIGLPLNMDGSESPGASAARALKGFIEQRHGVPVNLFDERLTSFAAEEELKQRKMTRGQKKQVRDALAACQILRDFLQARQARP